MSKTISVAKAAGAEAYTRLAKELIENNEK